MSDDNESATWNGLLPSKRRAGAENTFDLRTAFARHYFQAPKRRPEGAFENDADEVDADTSAGEGGKGKGSAGSRTTKDGATSTDGDPPSSPPSGEGASTDEDEDEKDDEVDNPRIKELSDEAAKYRRERNELRTQVEEHKRKLEGKQTSESYEATIRHLRLELAFERSAIGAHINDIEAAWRLAADDLKAVNINEEGAVDAERLQQIVDHVAKRYPYLTDDYAPQENVVTATGPSGRPMNGKRQSDSGMDRRALEKRFPALRRVR